MTPLPLALQLRQNARPYGYPGVVVPRSTHVTLPVLLQGLPVQYSVFTVVMRRKALICLLESLNALIKAAEDDIRCYRLPGHTDIKTLGRQYFPEDIMLFTDGINRLLSGIQKQDFRTFKNWLFLYGFSCGALSHLLIRPFNV